MKFKKLVFNYLNTGIRNNNDPESIQRIVVANIFSLLATFITSTLGINACLQDQLLLGIVLLSNTCIYLYAHLIFRYNWFSLPYRHSANLLTVSLMILIMYLIYSGGVQGTGPLWIYLVPPVVLFFGGLKKGIRNLFLFVCVVCIQLFYPDFILLDTEYSYEFKSRLIYSFVTVSALFAVYEAARQNSYQNLTTISRKFEQQAMHDVLSGLYNRRGMKANLELEYARSKRSQLNTSVIMCDIDFFKKVNDKYGHEKGDEVIKTVGKVFNSELRKQDSLARWGGEEYLFLLPTTNAEQAMVLAEKLREKIEGTIFQYKNTQFSITVSMGVRQFTSFDTIDDAINNADKKLYQAKSEGRNRCIM